MSGFQLSVLKAVSACALPCERLCVCVCVCVVWETYLNQQNKGVYRRKSLSALTECSYCLALPQTDLEPNWLALILNVNGSMCVWALLPRHSAQLGGTLQPSSSSGCLGVAELLATQALRGPPVCWPAVRPPRAA